METLEWQCCGVWEAGACYVGMTGWGDGENQSILRPPWPLSLSGPRPTLTLLCFPAQHTSSHWSKSRANTLQYKLQTLQQQKLKICCILLRSNNAALLPSIWLIRCDVIFRHVRIVSSVEWVHLNPHSCWSLPRNGLWLLTNAINYARLSNG